MTYDSSLGASFPDIKRVNVKSPLAWVLTVYCVGDWRCDVTMVMTKPSIGGVHSY